MGNPAVIWTFTGVVAAARFARGLAMRGGAEVSTELLWYSLGAVILSGGCLVWASVEPGIVMQQRIFLAIIGAVAGALVLVTLGEFIRPSAAQSPSQPQARSSTPAGKNNPAISAGHDLNIGHIGDTINQTIFPMPPQQDELSKNEGILYPADQPTPDFVAKCNVPSDALTVVAGSNVSWSQKLPHIVVEAADEPMLVIDKNSDGNIVITTLKIFDDRDDIIARVDSDGFWVRNSNRKKRPDKSTLVVYDHNDEEVLN